jgi:hypothetical protein
MGYSLSEQGTKTPIESCYGMMTHENCWFKVFVQCLLIFAEGHYVPTIISIQCCLSLYESQGRVLLHFDRRKIILTKMTNALHTSQSPLDCMWQGNSWLRTKFSMWLNNLTSGQNDRIWAMLIKQNKRPYNVAVRFAALTAAWPWVTWNEHWSE